MFETNSQILHTTILIIGLLDEQWCNLCRGDDPLVSREVLKQKVEATQSIDGISPPILPSKEVTKHQLIGGILVGSKTLGVL